MRETKKTAGAVLERTRRASRSANSVSYSRTGRKLENGSGWIGTSYHRAMVAAAARVEVMTNAPDAGFWRGKFTAGDIADEFGPAALEYTSLPRVRTLTTPASHYEQLTRDEMIVARNALRTLEIQTLWREVRREIIHETPAKLLPRMRDALPLLVINT